MVDSALLYAHDDEPLPEPVREWVARRGLTLSHVRNGDELMAVALRRRPRVALLDARRNNESVESACVRLKRDSYTGIVPTAVIVRDAGPGFSSAFAAGADEVIRQGLAPEETALRLDALLRRSDRDTLVHPSTRLPGTVEIEAEIGRRIGTGELFATCYADLDHFKEFNDRYSYYDGDRVIRIVARILHDVVKGTCGEEGFVGHIGGDDFIFVIPLPAVSDVCGEIVGVFDALVPCQYSEQDRRAGYFFGKDRRGQLHRVPLMTLSIGVVTNERRRFTHAAQVSELATEMKSYAKTLAGSVYTVDRRHDTTTPDARLEPQRHDALGVVEEQ